MGTKHKARVAKLEALQAAAAEPAAPLAPEDRVLNVFFTAPEMPLETAMKILGIKPCPPEDIFCMALLPPGSPPAWEMPPDSGAQAKS